MQQKLFLLILLTAASLVPVVAQNQREPRYTKKELVRTLDSTEFKNITPDSAGGFSRSYIEATVSILDLDDDSTTFVRVSDSVLLCIEGQEKNKLREGIFNFYLLDKNDHAHRYKIYEQEFHNDRLNGTWKSYTMKGMLIAYQTFRNDSLFGLSRQYWIDGKTIMDEKEFNGYEDSFIGRTYYPNGKMKEEVIIVNGKANGIGKKYYENGSIMEYAEIKDNELNGVRKYYYDNGQLWIEQNYQDGKSWNIIANYTRDGKKRNPGTLKNGNGTIIYYNENGKVRETETYINGLLKQ